jgi:hypothetical protein
VKVDRTGAGPCGSGLAEKGEKRQLLGRMAKRPWKRALEEGVAVGRQKRKRSELGGERSEMIPEGQREAGRRKLLEKETSGRGRIAEKEER